MILPENAEARTEVVASPREDDESSAAEEEEEAPAPAPSFHESVAMYLQGQVMGKSTQLAKLGERAQQLTAEIQQRNASLNEVRSQQLHVQSALGAVRDLIARVEQMRVSVPAPVDE